MTTRALAGCTTKPIGSYLKALGVLRLVGNQLDPSAKGSWIGDTFHLETSYADEELLDFFLHRYAPTPLVSPWNGGSGFNPKDVAGIKATDAIMATADLRFAGYREAITLARALVADPTWESGGKDKKRQQIARCRAELPDASVEWFDASVVLTNDRTVFPPLLGTGGNDGRLEFSSNFMQRLVVLLIEPPRRKAPDSATLLRGALFGDDPGPLVDATAGQFDPSSVEPPVSSATGRSTTLANPWDYLLLLEGALLFASGAARRLGGGTGIRAAMPFCVDSSPVGYGSSAEAEESRGEIWTPVWQQPATVGELARLLGEGRAQWGGGQATSGTDFAKAVATLGVDRGIDRFVRHGVVQRYGLSFLAVPLSEVRVGERPQVNVLRQVDAWLQRVDRTLPGAAATALRQVEAAEFRAASDLSLSIAEGLQAVLTAVAELETVISRSVKRDDVAPPVGGARTRLAAIDWVPLLDDGSIEFRLALALASARDRFPNGELDDHARTASSLALLLRPVQLDRRGVLHWSPSPARVSGLGRRRILAVLADALAARSVIAGQRASTDRASGEAALLAFDTGTSIPLPDLLALAQGQVDLDRLDRVLRGLLLIDWRQREDTKWNSPRIPDLPAGEETTRRATPAMAALLPFFHGGRLWAETAEGTAIEVALRPRPHWATQLAVGDTRMVAAVLDDALDRLRVAGLRPAPTVVRPALGESGEALATAALCALSPRSAARLIAQTCPVNAVHAIDPTSINDRIEESS